MNDELRVFLYHHTHWDREWWATFQDLRIRLVELIDELLDILDHDADFHSFLLDGQTSVLKDYLEVRPENRARLTRYIREGRIECGPWYILPDEFLVSGEAHIRNLWLGQRVAAELGIDLMRVGYLPDTFGHISQMPQILRGFGIDNAFVWRGMGGTPDTCKQEFAWESPNGSQVLGVWFPDGYYVVDFLHFDNPAKTYDETFGRVRRSLERWQKCATTDCLLMPYGGDHRMADSRLPRLLRLVNEDLQGFAQIRWSTLTEFVRAVQAETPDVAVRRGELRSIGEDLPHLLPGVLSTRMGLKQLNFEGQRWLERAAEPMSAMAWVYGRPYDANLLWKSWELLLQNHPHDSICGCSIDEVHREMVPRFEQSRQIAEILTEKSMRYIHERVDTSSVPEGSHVFVVHNTLPWTRSQVAHVVFPQDLNVHPRSHVLTTADGTEIPFDVVPANGVRVMSDKYWYSEIRFLALDIPGLGYQSFILSLREKHQDPKLMYFNAAPATAKLKGSAWNSDLTIGQSILENSHLRVEVMRDGSLCVEDKQTGTVYEGLNRFRDSGDAGDTYNYSPPLVDSVLDSTQAERTHVSIHHAGSVTATLRVDIDWVLPERLNEDRLSRSSTFIPVRISTFVTLAAQSAVVDIRTTWDNRIQDHRLQALFPLGRAVSMASAEGHFDVIDRPALPGGLGHGWPETPTSLQPQQGFVSVSDGTRGMTIANQGLPEYELMEESGTIAITLVRSVGWLSREDTLTRVGGAGPEVPVPDAQCSGVCSAEYAILLHRGDFAEARAYRSVLAYNTPLLGSLTDRHSGTLPLVNGLMELEGNHSMVMSACKRSEDGDALILRLWNAERQSALVHCRILHPLCRAYRVDLREERLGEDLSLSNEGVLSISAEPNEIVTIAFKFADASR